MKHTSGPLTCLHDGITLHFKVLSVRTLTTVGEVASNMAESIGLPEPSHYGIFQFGSDGGIHSNFSRDFDDISTRCEQIRVLCISWVH